MKHLKDYIMYEALRKRRNLYDKDDVSNWHYKVVVEWGHGDADGLTIEKYPFETEKEMKLFLEFTCELRGGFLENQGHGKIGYFGRNSRSYEEANKIANRYSSNFEVPYDKFSNRWSPSIEHIWVEIDNVIHNIIWDKPLKTNLIELPKIGDKIITNTGQICGKGPRLWNKPENFFYYYWDLKYMGDTDVDSEGNPGNEYISIEVEVTDCKIGSSMNYERTEWNHEEDKKTDSYFVYYELVGFTYTLLCKFMDKYITTNIYGFDPKYSSKYHYSLYGTNDYYLY